MHTVEEADSELELVVYNFDSSNAHKFVGRCVCVCVCVCVYTYVLQQQ